MTTLTLFGACAVTIMLVAVACAASSLYGWLSGTWPFGVIEGIWALIATRRWWLQRRVAISN